MGPARKFGGRLGTAHGGEGDGPLACGDSSKDTPFGVEHEAGRECAEVAFNLLGAAAAAMTSGAAPPNRNAPGASASAITLARLPPTGMPTLVVAMVALRERSPVTSATSAIKFGIAHPGRLSQESSCGQTISRCRRVSVSAAMRQAPSSRREVS